MSPALVPALAEMPKGLAAPSCAQLAMSGVAAPPPWSSKCYAFLEAFRIIILLGEDPSSSVQQNIYRHPQWESYAVHF